MMTWTSRLRHVAIETLPKHWRPSATYHYYRMRALLDRELIHVCAELEPGVTAVDVGANEGVYTHAFARRGAFVEAFEPQPECAAVLHAYARRRQNVRVHAVALGETTTTGTLSVPLLGGRPVSGWATLSPVASAKVLQVDVRPLDAFVLAKVGLIKIDVEGHELAVLRGAARTIARWRPVLVVEVERRHVADAMDSTFAFIESMDYAGYFLHPDLGAISVRQFDPGHHQPRHGADIAGGTYINNFIFRPGRDAGLGV